MAGSAARVDQEIVQGEATVLQVRFLPRRGCNKAAMISRNNDLTCDCVGPFECHLLQVLKSIEWQCAARSAQCKPSGAALFQKLRQLFNSLTHVEA